jgi:hypothetical protein
MRVVPANLSIELSYAAMRFIAGAAIGAIAVYGICQAIAANPAAAPAGLAPLCSSFSLGAGAPSVPIATLAGAVLGGVILSSMG